MSTNDESKAQGNNQNGNQNFKTLNILENKSLNSVNSENKESQENIIFGASISKNAGTNEKGENIIENTCDGENNKISSECHNLVLTENSNLVNNAESLEVSQENSEIDESDMSRSNIKSRLPGKTTNRSLQSNSKLPAELSGQPSVKNGKDDVKYWKNREHELLCKIAELESKVGEKNYKSHSPLDLTDLEGASRDSENLKNRLHIIEKELNDKQSEISTESNIKNFTSSDEIINHLKLQNEDLRNALAKMTAILRDKTTMYLNQEKKMAALVNQIESLKEVVAITKDLLNIRNMEVQHLTNDMSAMETKIDCERQRHNQMLLKMDEAVKLNTELKKEYENQLKLFQHLRDNYEKKICLLSQENGEKKESS